MARLDAEDALAFAETVGRVTRSVEASLGPEVVANRATAVGPGRPVRLEAFGSAYPRWRRRLNRELADGRARFVLRSDVAECYASIEPAVVARALVELGAAPDQARAIERLLTRWGDEGVRGLPVGPAPSAVLANAVLRSVDMELRETGARHVRWVDDVLAFTPDRATAIRAFDAYRRGLDRVGLRLNEGKTALLDDAWEVASTLRRRTSTAPGSAVR
jgi:Reverse transcriptase (RNA-dependent DNA polymerase)